MIIPNVKSTIPCLFKLIQLISLPHRTYKRPYKHISNGPFTHLFLLIICEITTHTPLKYRILYLKLDNTQCKFYHSMPLHTYTANFAPSSNLQEILLAYKHNSNDPPFAHLFVLIIFEPISYIYATHATQTSYFRPNIQRKVCHSSPHHTYKVQIHIH